MRRRSRTVSAGRCARSACGVSSDPGSAEPSTIPQLEERLVMINPSLFLRRALLADAIFSGVGAVGFTLGAGIFASLLNLPEALLRDTGLFLIASAIFVGWLA